MKRNLETKKGERRRNGRFYGVVGCLHWQRVMYCLTLKYMYTDNIYFRSNKAFRMKWIYGISEWRLLPILARQHLVGICDNRLGRQEQNEDVVTTKLLMQKNRTSTQGTAEQTSRGC
jgi:hypothetical protein